MKLARLQVTPDLLRAVLMLPEGVNVLRAREDEHYGVLELMLTGDALPVADAVEGKRPPLLVEYVKATTHDCGHRTLTAELREREDYRLSPAVIGLETTRCIVGEYQQNPAR